MSKPSFAPTIYHDGRWLYLDFGEGKPMLRYEFTDGGLHKALKAIPSIAAQPGYLSGGRNIYDGVAPSKGKLNGSAMPRTKISKGGKRHPPAFKPSDRVQSNVAEAVRKMLEGRGK